MNFLAHTYLSFKEPDILVGNFMADFINIREVDNLSPALRLGVDIHKEIDRFTDSHPNVIEAIHLLRPSQRKYAPVTLDILFDYFLTQRWSIYSSVDLRTFVDKAYEILYSYIDKLPIRLQEKMPRMIQDDFLYSCENIDRLIRTFAMVAKRAKFENQFMQAHLDMIRYEKELSALFDGFFPDIIFHIQSTFNFDHE